jgi:hypothetical protein
MYLMLEKEGKKKIILAICNKMQQGLEAEPPLSC